MKTRVVSVFLSIMIMVFCFCTFVVTEESAAQLLRKGTGIVPLTETEQATMLYMREEEKLARDVYIAMYDLWQAPVFSNIALSEQRHMDAVKKLMDKYGLEDSASSEIGVFNNEIIRDLYTELKAKGQQSLLEAYEVGKIIEIMDIEDLEAAMAETEKVDLDTVYGNLLSGSENHLTAFTLHMEIAN
jgi:hypothetical protein